MRRRADGVEPKCAHIPSIAQIAQDRICQLSLRKNRAVNFEAWLGRQNVQQTKEDSERDMHPSVMAIWVVKFSRDPLCEETYQKH